MDVTRLKVALAWARVDPGLLTFVIVKKSNHGKRSSSIHFHLLTEFG